MPGNDGTRPSVARVYNALLGGRDNVDADREVAAALTDPASGCPDLRQMARHNRGFITRAVTLLASRGIGQWVDVGSGLPPPPPFGAVHEAAREQVPDAHVVYVDHDPGVLTWVRTLQANAEGIAAIPGDLADPASVLKHPVTRECIDFGEPAAFVFGIVLNFLPPGQAREVVTEFLAPFPAGSAAVISTARFASTELQGRLSRRYEAAGRYWNHDEADVGSFFGAAGLTMVGGEAGDVRCWPMPVLRGTRPAYVLGGAGVREG